MAYEFVARNGIIALNNSIITGSLNVTGGITGSLAGTASYSNNALSASYAQTSSYADSFTVAGTLTAQKLVVQTISSSIVYSSGSNIFGNNSSNTQQFTGSVLISGSLFVGLPNTIPTDETTNEVLVLNTTTGRVGRRFAAATSGTSGTSGINGTSGTSGTSGNSGSSGTSGTSGVNGTSGTSGSSGTSGVNGTSGTSGSSGSSGVNGTSGTSGVNGSSGSSGSSGVNGTSGTSGANGSSGTSGVNGTSGTSGANGSSGTSGVNGTSGSSGSSGSSGVNGTSGSSGSSGSSGVNGTSGSSGVNGTSGTSGSSGTRGTSGTSGVNGTSGTSGSSGTRGTSGTSGVNGTSGSSGSSGSSGVSPTISNNADNRILTATGGSTINAESNLIYDGTTLQINQQGIINTTTPGISNYGLHFTGQTTSDYAAGMTWNGGTGTTGAQAGIYVQGSGAYGTRMFFGTTDAYVSGAKTAMTINEIGIVTTTRNYLQAAGSLRAPIFYDSDNTGYYIDPSSTSNLVGLTVANTISGNITGNAATATSATNATNATNATFVNSPDGDRVAGNKLPTTNPRQVRFDFATAGSVTGATGNYAGVMTYAPWDGTSASTGDSSYQLAFVNESGLNASGTPGLKLRNGINSTWNGWNTILHSSNYSGYSNFSGAVYGTIFYDSNDTTYYLDPNADLSLKVYGEICNANFAQGAMQPGALNIGRIDTNYGWDGTTWSSDVRAGILANCFETWEFVIHDNGDSVESVFRYDGGDQLLMGRDIGWGTLYIEAANSFRAPIFYDSNNTGFYFDGSSTGDSIRVAGDVVAYYSDERLKDIKENIPNAIDKILSLNGFYYEPNEIAQKLGYKKKLEIGLSAQEVERILPEIIKDAPIGHGYKTLDYGKLTPLLVEAIKEQQQQINELKTLINNLTK